VREAEVVDSDEEKDNWGSPLVCFPKSGFQMQSVVSSEAVSQTQPVDNAEAVLPQLRPGRREETAHLAQRVSGAESTHQRSLRTMR
jgi:hypothetical protein